MTDETTTTETPQEPTVQVTDAPATRSPEELQQAHNNTVQNASNVHFELVKRVMEFTRTLCAEDVRLTHNVIQEVLVYAKLNHEKWFASLTPVEPQVPTEEVKMTPVPSAGATVQVPVPEDTTETT